MRETVKRFYICIYIYFIFLQKFQKKTPRKYQFLYLNIMAAANAPSDTRCGSNTSQSSRGNQGSYPCLNSLCKQHGNKYFYNSRLQRCSRRRLSARLRYTPRNFSQRIKPKNVCSTSAYRCLRIYCVNRLKNLTVGTRFKNFVCDFIRRGLSTYLIEGKSCILIHTKYIQKRFRISFLESRQ